MFTCYITVLIMIKLKNNIDKLEYWCCFWSKREIFAEIV